MKRLPGIRTGKMEKLSFDFPSVLSLCLGLTTSLYFLARFAARRNAVALAIVFMSTGWSVCALIVSGRIGREFYAVVSYAGVAVGLFLLLSLFKAEFWEEYRRQLEAERRREREDRFFREWSDR